MRIGIDFGTSTTQIGYFDEEKKKVINLIEVKTGYKSYPSIAYFWFDNQSKPHLTFELADRQGELRKYPFFKMDLLEPKIVYGYPTREIIKGFFNHLQQKFLKEYTIEEIAICVPNNFGLNARKLLKEICSEVWPEINITLLSEPLAGYLGFLAEYTNALKRKEVFILRIKKYNLITFN